MMQRVIVLLVLALVCIGLGLELANIFGIVRRRRKL